MGVVGFFAWLLKKFNSNKNIKLNIVKNISTLYLDANCLIHPICQQVLSDNQNVKDIKKLEKTMIIKIIEYIKVLKETKKEKI
jgi:5'-3' exonuclease